MQIVLRPFGIGGSCLERYRIDMQAAGRVTVLMTETRLRYVALVVQCV